MLIVAGASLSASSRSTKSCTSILSTSERRAPPKCRKHAEAHRFLVRADHGQLVGPPARLRIVPPFAPASHASQAWRTVVGFGARSPPLDTAETASARHDFASASRAKVFRISCRRAWRTPMPHSPRCSGSARRLGWGSRSSAACGFQSPSGDPLVERVSVLLRRGREAHRGMTVEPVLPMSGPPPVEEPIGRIAFPSRRDLEDLARRHRGRVLRTPAPFVSSLTLTARSDGASTRRMPRGFGGRQRPRMLVSVDCEAAIEGRPRVVEGALRRPAGMKPVRANERIGGHPGHRGTRLLPGLTPMRTSVRSGWRLPPPPSPSGDRASKSRAGRGCGA